MCWLTFWPGNYIWSFSYTFGLQMRHIWTLRPGFYTEFRYKSSEHSGLAWGAIFDKMSKFQEMHTFWFWTCPEFPEIVIFPWQKPRRELQDRKELFRNFSPENSFIFLMKSKVGFFQKNWFALDFYWSKSLFYWKSKWSVWSIGTFSTIRIWKFRIEKGNYGGKVNF